MDNGVIGISAFMPSESEIEAKAGYLSPDAQTKKQLYSRTRTDSYRSGSISEYAGSGEWGALSEEERKIIVSQMQENRKHNDDLINEYGKGRFRLAVIGMAILAMLQLRRQGIIPYLPSLKHSLLGLLAYIAVKIYTIRAKPLANPHLAHPKIRHFPILGNTVDLVIGSRKGVSRFLHQIVVDAKFKTHEFTAIFGNRTVVVMDPIDRKYILKDNWKNYLKNAGPQGTSRFDELFPELFGRGIFATDKREWQDHRKIASVMFSVNGLRNQMEIVFKKHTEKLCKMLETHCESDGVIDLQNVFQSFTFDTICEIAFGVDTKSLDAAMRGEKTQFLVSFDWLQILTATRTFEPPFLWRMKKSLGIAEEAELSRHGEYVRKFVDDIVKERRLSSDFATRDDLLSLYIAHSRKTGQTYIEDDAYLRDVILNFMVAGRDTTSCTLTNWFKLIGTSARKEEIIRNLKNEVLAKFPNGTDQVNWENIADMPYADAAFNEAIRMYPPVGGDFRIAESEDMLPSGVKILPGMRVGFQNFSYGRDPSLWSEPDTFRPERWLQQTSDGKTKQVRRPDEYVLPVFWGGPRLCLGKDMARFEVKIVVSNLMKQFDFEVLPHEENFVNGPVIFYTQGLPVKVHRARA